MSTITLKGKSGNEYTFNVHPNGKNIKNKAVVYYVSKREESSKGGYTHTKIYIGETQDIFERFKNHHKQKCFEKEGFNCISVYSETSDTKRLEIEKDLVDNYDPPCNG